MVSLSDEASLDILRKRYGLWSRAYLWEAITEIEWINDRPPSDIFHHESYNVIFDPNAWNLSARQLAAQRFGCDGAPLGYQLTRDELIDLLRQSWIVDSDFYVLDQAGSLSALRTHEDPSSEFGLWVSTKKANP
jgi:hypothetical protein